MAMFHDQIWQFWKLARISGRIVKINWISPPPPWGGKWVYMYVQLLELWPMAKFHAQLWQSCKSASISETTVRRTKIRSISTPSGRKTFYGQLCEQPPCFFLSFIPKTGCRSCCKFGFLFKKQSLDVTAVCRASSEVQTFPVLWLSSLRKQKTSKGGGYAFCRENHCDSDSELFLSGRCCCLWQEIYSDAGPFVCTSCTTPLKIFEDCITLIKDNNCLAFPYRIIKNHNPGHSELSKCQRHCLYDANNVNWSVYLSCAVVFFSLKVDYTGMGDCCIFQWVFVHFVIFHCRVTMSNIPW